MQSTAQSRAIRPDTKLGGYEVEKLIGSGGMGEVYRARDTRLGREVAIKVLPGYLSQDLDRLRRFEQEARAAAALNHPNILAVFQMGTYEGAPYLVSELLEGGTLREQLLRGPMPFRKAIDIGVQIARGLAAAHDKGIVHRDLKPENLFVTKDGRIKILDFGLAKLTQPSPSSGQSALTASTGTEPGVVMGTVGYMAPEQVRGSVADHRCDIFVFGAILYEMLTEKRAFQKPTSAETMSAILNEELPSISRIMPRLPPALDRVVHRCVEKSPEQRFQSASDLAFALEALSDSGPSAVTAVASAKPRARLIWIGAGILAVAAGLVLWWGQPSAPPQIESVVQLTHDGQPKKGRPASLASDGSRLYFTEQRGGALVIAQVSVAGGETVPLASGLVNPYVMDIAPDSSVLLVSVGTWGDTYIGILPLPGGQLRRVVKGESAAFFPDGTRIAYCSGSAMYIAQLDGSNTRKISDRGCYPDFAVPPSISPDGNRIRFAVSEHQAVPASYWEIRADGAEPKRLEPPVSGWSGRWTPDGRHFIFEQNPHWPQQRNDLWFVSEKHGIFSRTQAPVRFTNGPLSFDASLPSRDGKRIYVIGFQSRGELIRYDSASKQFLPVLDGISARDAIYSADGKWLVYLSYPNHELWRSRPDGSDRLQITYAPIQAYWPHISPDAKQIQFSGYIPGQAGAQYIVDMAGGESKRIGDSMWAGTWSFDGRALLISVPVNGFSGCGLAATCFSRYRLGKDFYHSWLAGQGRGVPTLATDDRFRGAKG